MARQLPGDPGGKILIATDGVRFEIGSMPGWAKLYWYLRDDPKYRPDWNSYRGYEPPPNKLSKTD